MNLGKSLTFNGLDILDLQIASDEDGNSGLAGAL